MTRKLHVSTSTIIYWAFYNAHIQQKQPQRASTPPGYFSLPAQTGRTVAGFSSSLDMPKKPTTLELNVLSGEPFDGACTFNSVNLLSTFQHGTHLLHVDLLKLLPSFAKAT